MGKSYQVRENVFVLPDDYQVIMVLTKKNEEEKAALSMINGFQVLDINREVRLLN